MVLVGLTKMKNVIPDKELLTWKEKGEMKKQNVSHTFYFLVKLKKKSAKNIKIIYHAINIIYFPLIFMQNSL